MSHDRPRFLIAPPLEENQKPVLAELGLISRHIFKFLSYYTHKTIRTREKTRLIRGEYYDIVREAAMRFFREIRSERPDIFAGYTIVNFYGLNLKTIFDYGKGLATVQDLKNDIYDNLGFHNINADYPENLCYADGDRPYFLDGACSQTAQESDQTLIKGLGASRGIVEGFVLRLENPADAFRETSLADRILVTRTTDPAWVFIMSQCCGLVSEKGSLLSHTAIIGREMGIPTVVAAQGVMNQLKNMDRIKIDGENGTIEKLEMKNKMTMRDET
ncbi:MAG: hypothetical protein HQK54_18285 [Oligoflexales bacterium]|nr:hypothetical protein [Oligoflexales bacterium]